MSAVRELYEKMSLRRSLRYAGISRHMWYHKPKARDIGLDPATVQAVQRIGGKRPAYGTRCIAAITYFIRLFPLELYQHC